MHSLAAYAGAMQPCLRGSLVRQFADGQAELELLLDADIPEQSIEHTSDEELAWHLCRIRAGFSFTVDGRISHDVECLYPQASRHPSW
jgi:hypothetical protein